MSNLSLVGSDGNEKREVPAVSMICVMDPAGRFIIGDCATELVSKGMPFTLYSVLMLEIILTPSPDGRVGQLQLFRALDLSGGLVDEVHVNCVMWYVIPFGSPMYNAVMDRRIEFAVRRAGIVIPSNNPIGSN